MQSRLLTFTNTRGESITFRNNSSFFINIVEGLGDVDADIQMQQAPYQDGATYIDSVLAPRPISFQVNIRGSNDTDISKKRSQLAALFNPKLGPGTLEYRYGEIVRIIEAVPEHVPTFPSGFENRGRRHQVGLVDLICPNPYWRSPNITEEPAFEALFEFPSDEYWEEGEDGDLYFEMGMQRNDRIIDNDGDAPAPFQIDFYGPADSPYIENRTTGEFIRIKKRLEENQIMKINTADSSVIYVSEDGTETNEFFYIDLSTTFFMLQLGENDITCNCAISNNQKDFDIYYHKLYNAV